MRQLVQYARVRRIGPHGAAETLPVDRVGRVVVGQDVLVGVIALVRAQASRANTLSALPLQHLLGGLVPLQLAAQVTVDLVL